MPRSRVRTRPGSCLFSKPISSEPNVGTTKLLTTALRPRQVAQLIERHSGARPEFDSRLEPRFFCETQVRSRARTQVRFRATPRNFFARHVSTDDTRVRFRGWNLALFSFVARNFSQLKGTRNSRSPYIVHNILRKLCSIYASIAFHVCRFPSLYNKEVDFCNKTTAHRRFQ